MAIIANMAARTPQLIGESPEFMMILDRISDLATLKQPILIEGERGTGKELIAARLHFLSPRWEQSYRRINCAAYSDSGLELALFGDGHNDGYLLETDEGTLFLDNIECTGLPMQEKLAQLIEHGTFEPVDSFDTQTADIRFVFASGQDLPTLIETGTFSAELFDRIVFEVLHLPPLRDRPEDIIALTTYFGRNIASDLGADRFPGLTPEAMGFLVEQSWPGNIRQLKNVIERSVANAFLADETLADPIHTIRFDPFEGRSSQAAKPVKSASVPDIEVPTELETTHLSERVLTFERGLIDQAMELHNHHQGKAAQYLGLSYHQFRGLLRKHGLKK